MLQVTCAASKHAMKSKARMIITTVPAIAEKITRVLPLAFLLVLRTHNNTDGNKRSRVGDQSSKV